MAKNINTKFYEKVLEKKARLINFEESMNKKVNKVLNSLEKELVNELNSGVINPGMITDFKKTKLNNYLKETNILINDKYKTIEDITNKDLNELGEFTTDFVTDNYNKLFKAEVFAPINLKKIEILVNNRAIQGKTNKEWWIKQASNYRESFNQQMTLGLARGETIQELTKRITGSLEGVGITGISKREAEAMVRTSVIDINNTVAINTYRENDDVVYGIEWVATFDNRTTAICISLDGKQWTLDYKPIGHSEPYPGQTAHWNCRSTQIAVIKDFDNMNKKLKNKIPDRVRASIDGPIKKIDYEDWLKTKSKKFQDDVLGDKKAELWRSGKIKSTRDLISQQGRELTLEQIKEKFL